MILADVTIGMSLLYFSNKSKIKYMGEVLRKLKESLGYVVEEIRILYKVTNLHSQCWFMVLHLFEYDIGCIIACNAG